MDFRYAFMLAALLLIGLLASVGVSDASSPSPSLSALCKGEDVKLRTIDQLEALVKDLKSAGGECSDTVRNALRGMKKLTDARGTDVCTMDQAKAITLYVDSYLKDAPDGTKRGLPEPLEKFAIAYGMKVSGICSHRMVRELPLKMDSGYYMRWEKHIEEFFEKLSNWSPLSQVLDPIMKTGEVILPVDLMQALPGLAQHVHLFLPKRMGALRFKFICERVFQPLYEPLLLPLAHLNRAGFNNREFYWAWKHHYRGRLWSRAVFLCEIAKMIKAEPAEQGGTEAKTESEEEVAIMKALKDMNQNGISRFEKEESLPKRFVRAQRKRPGNTIYGRFDYSMKSLVKAFDANKDHVQLLREQILRRSFGVVRMMFKKKGFGKELTEAWKAARVQKGSDADLEEAKKMLVTLMESPQRDSVAYDALIQAPKSLFDLSALLIYYVITIPPVLVSALILRGKKYEIARAVDRFHHDYLVSVDSATELNRKASS